MFFLLFSLLKHLLYSPLLPVHLIICSVTYPISLTHNRAVYEKLRSVISENKELEKMISAGRVQQLGMEIGLLKRENEQLNQVIDGIPYETDLAD